MTITYPDGKTVKAFVLSHDENEIRAITAGSDDVLAFTRVNRVWLTRELEPVNILFEWQRVKPAPPLIADCVCSKDLASRLIRSLFVGSDEPTQDARQPEWTLPPDSKPSADYPN